MIYFKAEDGRVFAYESHEEMMTFSNTQLIEISISEAESLLSGTKDSDLSRLDIERLRKEAYADPISGSDVLFSASYRMRDMGEDGWESKKLEAIDRFLEIQKTFPWPEM